MKNQQLNNLVQPELVDLFGKKNVVVLKGNVIDGNSKAPLMADVTVVDKKTNKIVSDVLSGNDGNFMVVVEAGRDYGISSTAAGYTIASLSITTSKSDIGKEKVINLKLFPPSEGTEFVLRNIYFGFDMRHR